MASVLSVEALSKSFRTVRAVHDLSFSVRRGEIFALLGPNGAGKSTTVRILMNIIRPDAGSVHYHLDGAEPAQPRPSQLGYLPEDRGLYPDVSVIRTLTYFGVLRGMARRDARDAATRWLDRFELSDRADEKLAALSKGNQQKVQFVSAILHRPEFAILDEPFSGLDPVIQDGFLDILRELRNDGMTILLSAHQMQLVERLADRIHLMQHGQTVLEGSLDEIRQRSGSSNRIRVRVRSTPPVNESPLREDWGEVTRADDQLDIVVHDETRVSDVLVWVGSTFDVASIETEEVSLHDIYVRSVGQSDVERGVAP